MKDILTRKYPNREMKSQEASIIAISGSHGIMHGYLVLLPALIPLLGGELGNLQTIGWLASIVTMFYGFGSFPVGLISDHISKKTLITTSMALCGTSSIIVAFSPNIPIAALGFILLGLGASLYHPCGYAHMSLVSDELRGRYMGFQGLGGDMGMAISYFTSSLLGANFGWRNTFLIWGLMGIIIAFIDHIVIIDILLQKDGEIILQPINTLKRMFGTAEKKTLFLTFIIVILSGMLWTGVSNFIMVYITDVKMVALVIAGGLSTLKYTVGAFAQMIGGELSDKMGRKILLLFGYGTFSIGLIALTLAPSNLILMLILVALLGFTFFITQSPMNALLGDVSYKDTVGVTYGVNFTLKYGIGFFTPAIAGWLASKYSLNHVFWFFAVLSIFAFFVTLFIKERGN
jgi:MFS family permease